MESLVAGLVIGGGKGMIVPNRESDICGWRVLSFNAAAFAITILFFLIIFLAKKRCLDQESIKKNKIISPTFLINIGHSQISVT